LLTFCNRTKRPGKEGFGEREKRRKIRKYVEITIYNVMTMWYNRINKGEEKSEVLENEKKHNEKSS